MWRTSGSTTIPVFDEQAATLHFVRDSREPAQGADRRRRASPGEIFERRGISFVVSDELRDLLPLESLRFVQELELRERCSVAVAFGGDGTMLAAGRLLAGSGVPLIGVNLGKLGFLAEFSVDDLEETLDEYLGGGCHEVERTLLEGTFPEDPGAEPIVGMNDIVVDKRGVRDHRGALMLKMEILVNGDFMGAFRADGMIVATPTGSTAYSLAVGGPIVAPNAGVTVIAPIAPHMLTARPVVVRDSSIIEIIPSADNEDEVIRVYADGQVHRTVAMPCRIRITRLRHTVSLVKRTSTTYFDVLRAKLLWGREPAVTLQETIDRE